MKDVQHEKFEQLLRLVDEASLRSVTLTKQLYHSRICQRGRWRYTNDTLSITASASLQQIRQLRSVVEELERNDGTSTVELSVKMQKGDPLPKLTNVSKVGYVGLTSMEHQKGQRLVLVTYSPRHFKEEVLIELVDTLQSLTKKEEFRVVALWAGMRYDPEIQRAADAKRWTNIQHYLVSELDDSGLYSFVDADCPTVYIVSPEGIIDDVRECRQTSQDLAKWLSDNISGKPIERISEDTVPILGQRSWLRIREIINNLPQRSEHASNLRLELEAKYSCTYSKGRLEWKVQPLKLQYRTVEQEAEGYDEMTNELIRPLLLGEYFILASSKVNVDLQLRLSCRLVTQLLHCYQLQSNASIVIGFYLDFKAGDKWQEFKWVGQPDAVYKPGKNFTSGTNFTKQLRDSMMGISKNHTRLLYDKLLPFKMSGTPFFGIDNLSDYQSGSPRRIGIQKGVVQFILVVSRLGLHMNFECIQRFVDAVSKHREGSRLHIISIHGKNFFLDGILKNHIKNMQIPNIHLYIATTDNETITAIDKSSQSNTLTVDRDGQLVLIDSMRTIQQIQEVIRDPEVYQRGIPKDIVALYRNLPNEQIYKQIQSTLKQLPYEVMLEMTFDEVFPDYSDPSNSIIYRPSFTIFLKKEDRHILNPFFELPWVKPYINLKWVNPVELPQGERCSDCNEILRPPYYYFIVSKIHKCVNCAEKCQPNSLEKLLRYPLLESSVLMMEGAVAVGMQTLGRNIQPASQNECLPHDFTCNGCGKDGAAVGQTPRYTCLKCEEDSDYKRIDFCETCAQIVRGQDLTARGKILTTVASCNGNHRGQHPLLRILYNPRSYREY